MRAVRLANPKSITISDNLWRGNVLSNLTWEGSDAGGFYVCGQDGTGYTSRGNVVENNLCAFSLH